MKPSIPHPCSENWDDMKIGLISRHCDSCQKDVMDFTQKSRHEILEYLIENRNQHVCARIFPSQLDYRHEEIVLTIRALEKKHRNTNLSFYLLTMATLSLMACESDLGKTKVKETVKKEATCNKNDETIILGGIDNNYPPPRIEQTTHTKGAVKGQMKVAPPQETIIGDMVAPGPGPDEYNLDPGPRMIAEKMPEFKGGTKALMQYIQENLKYPQWESENDIQGTVYVSVVIDEKGKVTKPEILRSVAGSKNFDAEVMRVITTMPDWIPGEEKGVPVAVKYNLPFRFRK